MEEVYLLVWQKPWMTIIGEERQSLEWREVKRKATYKREKERGS